MMRPFLHVSILDVKVALISPHPRCLRYWLPISDVNVVPEVIELKAFAASSRKFDSSLKIFSIACIAALDPVSWLSHTYSDQADETTSFLSTDTVTFPVIL